MIVHDFPQSVDTCWNCHVLSRHIFLAQVAPKLDDREIFVTHLPQKAGTEDPRTRRDLFNVFFLSLSKVQRCIARFLQDGVRFLLGNFGNIDEAIFP